MKKIIIPALLSAIMLLSACGGNADTTTANGGNASDAAAVTASPADITSAVIAEVPVSSGVAKTKDDVADYYDVDASTLANASFYICGSGAYPDELAVLQFNDAAGAEAGKTALQTRLDSQIELYTTYTPDEMYKLEGAKVFTSGNYAVYIALSDNDKANEIVKGYLG